MTHSYAAVILSAGFSSRLKCFKPLLKINNLSFIDRVIGIFTRDSTDVYVVAGYRKDELKNQISNSNITLIDNPDYEQGMFSSIKVGVKSLSKQYSAFFLLPVDIPLVRPYTITRLIKQFEYYPEAIVYPVFNGKRGHPLMIPCSLIPKIQNSNNSGGLRNILEHFKERSIEIEVPDRFIHVDVDTMEDYQNICREFSSSDIPNLEECKTILDICEVEIARRCHSYKVAEIAACIGRALIESGNPVILELIQSAAILHDIAKQQPQHDLAAGRILKEMGFGRIGEMVGVHSFLDQKIKDHALETTVVYIADKFVQGDKLVSLEERYSVSNHRFKVDSNLKEIIIQRKQRALEIKKELEYLIHKPLELVIGL